MADEGGVWRTVSGRRVFIRDGQSLTEAMKESGKFKEESNAGAGNGAKYRIWGKAAGTGYENLSRNKYRLTGEREGEEIEIPENNSGEFELYKAPQTSGFVNGKFVGDKNENAILTDGRIVLNDHDFNNDAVYKVRSIIEAETLRLAGMRKEGVFYRGTDNKKEIEYLKSGTMRASTNHSTGEAEDGVSVWDTRWMLARTSCSERKFTKKFFESAPFGARKSKSCDSIKARGADGACRASPFSPPFKMRHGGCAGTHCARNPRR